MNDFMSMTELGRLYGVSSHQIGRWLKGLGLRYPDGQPSKAAKRDGYVKEMPCEQPGVTFFVWHTVKTTGMLDGMGYPRAGSKESGVERAMP